MVTRYDPNARLSEHDIAVASASFYASVDLYRRRLTYNAEYNRQLREGALTATREFIKFLGVQHDAHQVLDYVLSRWSTGVGDLYATLRSDSWPDHIGSR
jgi:hypothetical protein